MKNLEETLCKLYKVFKDGYRPSRLKQTYRTWIRTDDEDICPIDFFNCVAHAFFNPTNEILKEYKFSKSDDVFGKFSGSEGSQVAFSEITHFVKDVGLKVEECKRDEIVKKYGSWKVDAYFRDGSFFPDYHFMLSESKGIYSHKQGFFGDVSILCTAPQEYCNYTYCLTYLITNPNASESFKFNKPLQSHSAINLIN